MSIPRQRTSLTLSVVVAALLLMVGVNVTASADGHGEGAGSAARPSAPRLAPETTRTLQPSAATSPGSTYTYRLTAPGTVSSFTVNLGGLPRGRYVASYSMIAADSGVPTCGFRRGGVNPFEALGYGTNRGGFFATATGTAVLHKGRGTTGALSFTCFSGGGSMTPNPDSSSISNITLVRAGTVTSGTAGS